MKRFPAWWSALAFAAVLLVAQSLVAALLARLIPTRWPSLVLVMITNLVVFLPAFVAGTRWAGLRWPAWGRITWPLVGAIALTSGGGSLVLGQLSNLLQFLWPMPPRLFAFFQSLQSQPLALVVLGLGVVAPLTEELLFRGLLLPGLERRYGFPAALVGTSVLFGVFHLNPWQALPAAAAGLYLGWLTRRTQGLGAPIVAHALFNALPLILAASGWVTPGYNEPGPVHADWESTPVVALGAVALGLGLALTRRWAPLSPPVVSDTLPP